MADAKKITPQKILKALKDYCGTGEDAAPVWLVKHESATWVATSFWAFRPSPLARLAFEDLWEQCNIRFEAPQRIIAGLAVTQKSSDVPNIAKLFPAMSVLEGIEPRPLADGTLLHEQVEDTQMEMWRRLDGSWSVFNTDYARIIRHFGCVEDWMQGPDPLGVAVGFEGGAFAAILAAHRVSEEKILIRDPDLPQTLWGSD